MELIKKEETQCNPNHIPNSSQPLPQFLKLPKGKSEKEKNYTRSINYQIDI